MADLEQVPGTLNLKFPAGDDVNIKFSMDFNASGYTWIVTAHKENEGSITIPVAASVQTSVLTIVQATFYASTTTNFVTTGGDIMHSWKMKYEDDAGLVRTFLSGTVSII